MKSFILFCVIACIFAGQAKNCVVVFNNLTQVFYPFYATYDLNPLRKDKTYYILKDSLISEYRNLTYYINFCENIATPPIPACIKGSEGPNGTYQPRPAFQGDAWGNSCYHLGDDIDNGKWELLDNVDPSVGMSLTYDRGSSAWCGGPSRSLELRIRCSNYYVVPSSVPIVEVSGCVYRLTMSSIFGCPMECGVGDRWLCNNQGVCSFDQSIKKPRCYCNSNYFGDTCSFKGSRASYVDTTSYILIGIIIFLTILFVVMILIWKKISGLRLDKTVYTTGTEGVRVSSKYEKI